MDHKKTLLTILVVASIIALAFSPSFVAAEEMSTLEKIKREVPGLEYVHLTIRSPLTDYIEPNTILVAAYAAASRSEVPFEGLLNTLIFTGIGAVTGGALAGGKLLSIPGIIGGLTGSGAGQVVNIFDIAQVRNWKRGGEVAISLGVSNIIYAIDEQGAIIENNPYMNQVFEQLAMATSLLVQTDTEEELKNILGYITSMDGYLRSAVLYRNTSLLEQEIIANLGLYLSFENLSNLDIVLETMQAMENWPGILKAHFQDMKEALIFANSLDVNIIDCLRTQVVQAYIYAETNDVSNAIRTMDEVTKTAYRRVHVLLQELYQEVVLLGEKTTTLDRIQSRINTGYSKIDEGDFLTVREHFSKAYSQLVEEKSKIIGGVSTHLAIVKNKALQVKELIRIAATYNIQVSTYERRLNEDNNKLTLAEQYIQEGLHEMAKTKIIDTETDLDAIKDELQPLVDANAVQQLRIIDSSRKIVNVRGTGRNIPVYIRDTFVLKNESTVTIAYAEKELTTVPQIGTLNYSDSSLGLNVDIVVRGNTIVAKMLNIPASGTVRIELWYEARILDVSKEIVQLTPATETSTKYRLSLEVVNYAQFQLDNVPLSVDTEINGALSIIKCESGTAEVNGSWIIITTNLLASSTSVIKVDFEVDAYDVQYIINPNISENVEALYSQYVTKRGTAVIQNKIGQYIREARISLPLYGADVLRLYSEEGESVATLYKMTPQDETVSYTISSIPVDGKTFLVILEIPNTIYTLLENMNSLRIRIQEARADKNYVTSHGYTLPEEVENNLSTAEIYLNIARDKFDMQWFSDAQTNYAVAEAKFTSARRILDNFINTILTKEDQANYYIEKCENLITQFEGLLYGVETLLPAEKINEERTAKYNFELRLLNLRDKYNNNLFDEVIEKGQELKRDIELERESVKQLADGAIANIKSLVQTKQDVLNNYITIGELLQLDMTTVEQVYKIPAQRYYENALSFMAEGNYQTAKEHLYLAHNLLQTGIDLISSNITIAIEAAGGALFSSINDLSSKLLVTSQNLTEASLALSESELRNIENIRQTYKTINQNLGQYNIQATLIQSLLENISNHYSIVQNILELSGEVTADIHTVESLNLALEGILTNKRLSAEQAIREAQKVIDRLEETINILISRKEVELEDTVALQRSKNDLQAANLACSEKQYNYAINLANSASETANSALESIRIRYGGLPTNDLNIIITIVILVTALFIIGVGALVYIKRQRDAAISKLVIEEKELSSTSS